MSTSCVRRSVRRREPAHADILGRVASAPPAHHELERLRKQADRFIAALDEEYYLHFAGLKESLELAPIYERYRT